MKTVGGGGRTFHCPSWKKQVQSFPLSYAYGWATVEKRIVGKHQKADALVGISLPPCLGNKTLRNRVCCVLMRLTLPVGIPYLIKKGKGYGKNH